MSDKDFRALVQQQAAESWRLVRQFRVGQAVTMRSGVGSSRRMLVEGFVTDQDQRAVAVNCVWLGDDGHPYKVPFDPAVIEPAAGA